MENQDGEIAEGIRNINLRQNQNQNHQGHQFNGNANAENEVRIDIEDGHNEQAPENVRNEDLGLGPRAQDNEGDENPLANGRAANAIVNQRNLIPDLDNNGQRIQQQNEDHPQNQFAANMLNQRNQQVGFVPNRHVFHQNGQEIHRAQDFGGAQYQNGGFVVNNGLQHNREPLNVQVPNRNMVGGVPQIHNHNQGRLQERAFRNVAQGMNVRRQDIAAQGNLDLRADAGMNQGAGNGFLGAGGQRARGLELQNIEPYQDVNVYQQANQQGGLDNLQVRRARGLEFQNVGPNQRANPFQQVNQQAGLDHLQVRRAGGLELQNVGPNQDANLLQPVNQQAGLDNLQGQRAGGHQELQNVVPNQGANLFQQAVLNNDLQEQNGNQNQPMQVVNQQVAPVRLAHPPNNNLRQNQYRQQRFSPYTDVRRMKQNAKKMAMMIWSMAETAMYVPNNRYNNNNRQRNNDQDQEEDDDNNSQYA